MDSEDKFYTQRWSRTLSMARALCELQLELKNNKHIPSFQPRTPQKKDSKKKLSKKRKVPMRLDNEVSFGDREGLVSMTSARENINLSSQIEKEGEEKVPQLYGLDSGIGFSSGRELPDATCEIGNFPCPEELANLREEFLTRRCGLGYRAGRILSLARDVVENKIHLKEFEEVCNVYSYERYNILSQKLLAIDGFGPFTCANVLMCMGYYHKIPSDSETIRHMKQVHSKNCTMRTIDRDLEQIYGKYAPFQFLAYWIELWAFYETRYVGYGLVSYEISTREYEEPIEFMKGKTIADDILHSIAATGASGISRRWCMGNSRACGQSLSSQQDSAGCNHLFLLKKRV